MIRRPRRSAAVAVAALVVAAATVADPGGWFPYLSMRWAVLVAAAGATAVVLVARGVRWADLPGPAKVWAALGAVVVASALASGAPGAALTGALDRRMGAITWLAHGVLFVGAAVAIRHRRDLRTVARGVVVAGVAVAALTAAQQLGWDWPAGAVNRARPGGPFGNADVLGVWCALTVPVAIGLAVDRRERDAWRLGGLVAAALGVAASAASGARGGWAGLAVAIGVLTVVGSRRAGWTGTRRGAVLAAGGLGLVVVLAATGTLGRSLEVLDGTARGRVDTWVVAGEAIADRPALGWGPDGFVEGLQRHVDDSYERTYTRRLLPDRAHSAPLDVAGSFGLAGLVAWGAVLVATGASVRAAVRARPGPLVLGAAAGLAGLVVAELTLFPTADVDAVGWLLAGALVGLAPRPVAAAHPRRPLVPRVLAVGCVALVAAVVTGSAVAGVRADRSARAASDALAMGRPASAVAASLEALRREPHQPMAALLLAAAAEATADRATIAAALDEVEAVRGASPDDGRLVLAEGALLAACDTDCEPDRGRVERLAAGLVARDPARSDGWRLVAQLAEHDGRADDALAARRRVVDLAPRSDRAWRELAESAWTLGRRPLALDAAGHALRLDPLEDANLEVLSRVRGRARL